MSILKTFAVSVLTFVILANIPAYLLSKEYWFKSQKFGSLTYTTLSGTESVSAFPTLWNSTLASLDAEVMELSDWYATTSAPQLTALANLATIGTITSGTWNGTTITAANGGTGSTTLSSNQVLLGNGTGIVKTVNGFGSSGQFLTSQGAGTAPAWTSGTLDTSINYNWTGNHNFAGNTYIKTLTSSSSVTFNNAATAISYAFPMYHGASSTVLAQNGTGGLSWMRPDFAVIASSTVASAIASTTLSTIPYATDLRVIIEVPSTISGNNVISLQFNSDTGTNYNWSHLDTTATGVSRATTNVIRLTPSAPTPGGFYSVLNVTNVLTRSKVLNWQSTSNRDGSGIDTSLIGFANWVSTTAAITSITIGAGGGNLPAGTRITVYGSNL